MAILIIRHGQSLGNANGDYSVKMSDSLSDRGWEQAEALAKRLQDREIASVIVSPLQRAMETAMPYLRRSGKTAEIWPELAECCWQEPVDGLADDWPAQAATIPEGLDGFFHFRDKRAIRPAPGETFIQGRGRVYQAYKLLKKQREAEELTALFTHGHFIREFVNLALDMDDAHEYCENCAMSLLEWDGGQARLRFRYCMDFTPSSRP